MDTSLQKMIKWCEDQPDFDTVAGDFNVGYHTALLHFKTKLRSLLPYELEVSKKIYEDGQNSCGSEGGIFHDRDFELYWSDEDSPKQIHILK